ncbi:MAG: hypothetical protein LBS74_00020 [Oscillospiraceae bacterium]|nr:hypothetical protein [Oscillospiraceae bacterium]
MTKPHKTINISCDLPANAKQIWPLLLRIDTLKYIAAPYAAFVPLSSDTANWNEGASLLFNLRIWGFIPLGTHTVFIKRIDEENLLIQSEEHNRHVPVWNHKITLTPLNNHATHYTDEVEICAGALTWLVALWANLFYRHRQKKWRKLCKEY